MSSSAGTLCFSIDSRDADPLSVQATHRRRELTQLTEKFGVPSNHTIDGKSLSELPRNAEVTVEIPKSIDRKTLIRHLQTMSAQLLRDNATLSSVVLDPHEARNHWDILVRQGCSVSRPRTAGVTSDVHPRIVRGGLWVVPLTCQFVGGSRRSVRSLFGTCQRQLVEATRGGVFHLSVDIGSNRDSWNEELTAISALLETANRQRAKGRLRCARLSELPAILTKKSSRPMLSILKAA